MDHSALRMERAFDSMQKPNSRSLPVRENGFSAVADEPLSNWQHFILHAAVLAPFSIIVFWAVVSACLGPAINRPLPPPDLQGVESDLGGATTLACASTIAGILVTSIFPSLQRSARWMPALGIVLLAVLAPDYGIYMAHDDRPNHWLAILDWMCDPNTYPGYAYIFYSFGARLSPVLSAAIRRISASRSKG